MRLYNVIVYVVCTFMCVCLNHPYKRQSNIIDMGSVYGG